MIRCYIAMCFWHAVKRSSRIASSTSKLLMVGLASLCVFGGVQAQSSKALETLGENLYKSLKKNDEAMFLSCFSSREEVKMVMEKVNAANGGEGVLDYEVDSIYTEFRDELERYFYGLLPKGKLDGVSWEKTKFEEAGLASVDTLGGLKMATVVLIVRQKKEYYMVSFPQCFYLDEQWKIGAVALWEGRVTK